jgi:protoheme ferro-lyase
MLTRRMSAARAGAEDTAALLISHGVPEQHAAGSQQFLACERSFANRVRMGLIEDGWEEGSVRIAWSQWLDPDVTSELRHLAALGYRRILVNAVTRPIDSLSSTTDIALAIRAAHIDSEVDIEILEPWGDDPMVIDALNAHVEDALRNQEP